MAAELSRIERKRVDDTRRQPTEGKGRKISFITLISMIFVGIILDVFSLLPAINELTIFIADLIFIPWFYACGMKFTGRRIATIAVTTIAEAIPLISIFPMITVSVLINYYLD